MYLKKPTVLNAKPSAYYFYVKTKISLEFHICIFFMSLTAISC